MKRRMKKVISLMLAFAVTVTVLPLTDVSAAGQVRKLAEEDWEYVFLDDEDDTIEITGYTGKEKGDLIIPDRVDGYTVSSIGDEAFIYCEGFDGKLVLPSGLKNIGDSAFAYCTQLNCPLELPDSLESIGVFAFDGCEYFVKDINIPADVWYIGAGAFAGCTGIDSIQVAEANEDYSSYKGNLYNKDQTELICYINAQGKNQAEFPPGLTQIGDYAFCEYYELPYIKLPATVTEIGEEAFNEGPGLIVEPGSYAESYAESNKVLYHYESEEHFYYNHLGTDKASIAGYVGELGKELNIPAKINDRKVTEIAEDAFTWRADIKGSVILPEGLETIGGRAFNGCNNISRITVPASVNSIGAEAFEWCESLVLSLEKGSYAETYAKENNIPYKYTNQFQVTFINKNKYDKKKVFVDPDSPVKKPLDPSRKGYTFQGWYDENGKYDFSKKVTKDLVLAAHWKVNAVSAPAAGNYITKLPETSLIQGGELGSSLDTGKTLWALNQGRSDKLTTAPGKYFGEFVYGPGRSTYWANYMVLEKGGVLNQYKKTDSISPYVPKKMLDKVADIGENGGYILKTDGTLYDKTGKKKLQSSVKEVWDYTGRGYGLFAALGKNGTLTVYQYDSKMVSVPNINERYETPEGYNKSYIYAKNNAGKIIEIIFDSYKEVSERDVKIAVRDRYDDLADEYFLNKNHELFYLNKETQEPVYLKDDAQELLESSSDDLDLVYVTTKNEVYNLDLNKKIADNVRKLNCYDGEKFAYITDNNELYISVIPYDPAAKKSGTIDEEVFASAAKIMTDVKDIKVQTDFYLITRLDGTVWMYSPNGLSKGMVQTKRNLSASKISAIKTYTYTGKAITPSVTVKYGSVTLKKDRDYTVKYTNNVNPGTASVTITGKGDYTGTKKASFKIALSTPSGLKQSSRTTSSVKLSWKKISGASGYQVYRRTYGSSTFKKAGTVTKGTTASFTNKKLSYGQYYQYRIRAYKKTSKGTVYSGWSKVITANTAINTPSLSRVNSPKKKQAAVSWKKSKSVTGYQVYRATSKKGKYKRAATVKSSKYTDKKVSRHKTYYYKVRAYKKVRGKIIYSSFSKVKSTRVK